MRIALLSHVGCPNAAAAHDVLRQCLTLLGVDAPIAVQVGGFPSPTILIDGVDVMRPEGVPTGESCRLDLPNRDAVLAALRRAAGPGAEQI